MSNETKGLRRAFGAVSTGALVAGIGAVTAVVAEGSAEIAENQKIMAQSAAVVKSTGGAANVTTREIDRLATAIHRKTGIDDASIARGENMLLTFTNVRNEVGKGPKIFTEATKTLVDMSVALDQDASKGAIQLGKALNDPVRGVTALTKVGVTFTEGQRKTIASLVKTGQTAKAQQIILAELNKEFGGSAEAYGKTMPARIARTREAFATVSAEIVERLMPAAENAVDGIEDAIDAIEKWANSAEGQQQIDALAGGFQTLTSFVGQAGGALVKTTGFLIDHRNVVVPAAAGVAALYTAHRAYTIVDSATTAIRAATIATNGYQAAMARQAAAQTAVSLASRSQATASVATTGALNIAGQAAGLYGSKLSLAATNSAAAAGAITNTATRTTAAAGAFGKAGGKLAGIGGAALGLVSPAGIAVAAVGGIVAGVVALEAAEKRERAQVKATADAWRAKARAVQSSADTARLVSDANLGVKESNLLVERSTLNYNAAVEASGRRSLAAREALVQLQRAKQSQRDATERETAAEKKSNEERTKGVANAKTAAEGLNRLAELRKKQIDAYTAGGSKDIRLQAAFSGDFNRRYGDELKQLTAQEKDFTAEIGRVRKNGYGAIVQEGNKYVAKTGSQAAAAATQEIRLRRMTNDYNVKSMAGIAARVRPSVAAANREVAKVGNVKLNRDQILARLSAPFRGLGGSISALVGKITVGIDAAINWGKGLFGDAFDAGGLPPGVSASLGPFAAIGQKLGLSIPGGGGKRAAGTRTASGGISDHSSGHAIDLAGPKSGMRKMAEIARRMPRVKQVIYSPLGMSNGGSGWGAIGNAKVEKMHYSHVHVAAYQRGGVAQGAMGAGIVRGTGMGDTVPALLEPGEVVVNRRAVAAFGGPDAFHGATNLAVPRFQAGAVVRAKKGKIIVTAAKPTKVTAPKKLVADRVAVNAAAVQRATVAADPNLQLAAAQKSLAAATRDEALNDQRIAAQRKLVAAATLSKADRAKLGKTKDGKKKIEAADALAAKRREALGKMLEADKTLNERQAELGDSVVDLKGQIKEEAEQRAKDEEDRRVALAESSTAERTANNNMAKAVAARTDTLDDDVLVAREDQAIAAEKRRVVEAEIAAGGLSVEAYQALVAQRNDSIMAEAEAAAAVRDLTQRQRVQAAENATGMRSAELDVKKALAEASETITDDVDTAREELGLAREKRAIIERELDAGDLDPSSRLELLQQRAAAIRAETQVAANLKELEKTTANGGLTNEMMQQLVASNDAFLAALGDALRNERSNVTINPTFTSPVPGANSFLESVRYQLTQSGAGGGI